MSQIYCVGETTEDALSSTNPTEAEKTIYTLVVIQFDILFKVRKMSYFFDEPTSTPMTDSEDQCITMLYQLAENCNYQGEFKDQMTRKRLVARTQTLRSLASTVNWEIFVQGNLKF